MYGLMRLTAIVTAMPKRSMISARLNSLVCSVAWNFFSSSTFSSSSCFFSSAGEATCPCIRATSSAAITFAGNVPLGVGLVVGVIEVREPDHEDPLVLVQDDGPVPGVVNRELELTAVAGIDVKPRDVDQPLELDPGADGNEGDRVGGDMYCLAGDEQAELPRGDDDLGRRPAPASCRSGLT